MSANYLHHRPSPRRSCLRSRLTMAGFRTLVGSLGGQFSSLLSELKTWKSGSVRVQTGWQRFDPSECWGQTMFWSTFLPDLWIIEAILGMKYFIVHKLKCKNNIIYRDWLRSNPIQIEFLKLCTTWQPLKILKLCRKIYSFYLLRSRPGLINYGASIRSGLPIKIP